MIDWENADQRTTSEGQAYAMLQAVLIDDRDTFDRTLAWAEENLARRDDSGVPTDHLWAWKWGPEGAPETASRWGILDQNFATDADIDAATALIMASRRWGQAGYLELAKSKLADIWDLSTVEIQLPDSPYLSGRHLLPGPAAAFHPEPEVWYLNPSYVAPYAYRMFAQVDRRHSWQQLVSTGYVLLEQSSEIATPALPSDWVMLHAQQPHFRPLPPEMSIQSGYGFDAYRVWWRVSLDLAWFNSFQARRYLSDHLAPLVQHWRQQERLPARIGLSGEALVDYTATSQYAMIYPALRPFRPTLAEELRSQTLALASPQQFWDNDSAYYSQNMAWLGLFPPEWVPQGWLRP